MSPLVSLVLGGELPMLRSNVGPGGARGAVNAVQVQQQRAVTVLSEVQQAANVVTGLRRQVVNVIWV
jgi:hypothetical protein